jgi:radical SAM protein with 4Fe4S-binding SPASM domain
MDYEIEDLLLSVTNFCLGSCVYCNLKDLDVFEHDQEWLIFDVDALFSDQYLDGLKNIHLTGGEPILSPKLWETCKLIKKYHPDVRLNMPVSGFFPETTYRYMKKIHEILPQLRIDISVDGNTKEVHERTRGPGSWEPLNRTIDLLHSIDGLKVQFGLTLMDSNFDHINLVMDWANKLGNGFYISYPHFGTRFGHDVDKHHSHTVNFVNKVNEQVYAENGYCTKRPLNKQIWETQKAVWLGKEVYHDCLMGRKSLDIDPFGNVYPCMVYSKEQIMGNIKHQSLGEILESNRAQEVLAGITAKVCQPCLMPCCPWKKNYVIDGTKVGF